MKHQDNDLEKPFEPVAQTGNASNPLPQPNDQQSFDNQNQLLDKKAEKYLREVANIEDVPDPEEQQQADDTLTNQSNIK